MLVRCLQHYLSSTAVETKGTGTTLGTPQRANEGKKGDECGEKGHNHTRDPTRIET